MNETVEKRNKHIYGAYLNMARQNAFITLSHISKLLGSENPGEEANLSQMEAIAVLNRKNAKPEEKDKALKLLHKHFPFLKTMADNYLSKMNMPKPVREKEKKTVLMVDTAAYHSILVAIFNTLNLLRNQYSHHLLVDPRLEEKEYLEYNRNIVYGLKRTFEGGRRMVKTRFSFTDRDMNFIIRDIRRPEFDPETRRKKFVENERFFYKLDTPDKLLSAKGLTFFICLFLEKKYITLFLDNAELDFFGERRTGHETPEQEKKIMREIFGLYRIRLPRTRIDSTKSKFALGLDILNELKKCPHELFDTFNRKDQEIFRVKNEADESGVADENGHEIVMKRYQNRFPFFALKYMDERKMFAQLRFQVSLGKYRHTFYEKKGIDSDSADRVRCLQKELNGFGRLAEIEEKRKTEWAGLIRPFDKIVPDTADTQPYITDQQARYVINGNRVGIGMKGTLKTTCFLPPLDSAGKAPDAWMSIHELPGMLFHKLLCDKTEKSETEDIIVGYIKSYRKLFSDIQKGILQPLSIDLKEIAGLDERKEEDKRKINEFFRQEVNKQLKAVYQIDFSDIPEKIRDYLTGKNVDARELFERRSEEQIGKMIDWSERKLERLRNDKKLIGNKDNKVGKEKHVEIKAGRLARFLAEDIVLMQPGENNGKNKITGMNFQIMQASLAIYDKPVDKLRFMFENAGLIDGKNAHPFLVRVLNKQPENTIRFYEIYMQQRIFYLKECWRDRRYSQYSFLYPERRKWARRDSDFYIKLTANYLEQPIELPRGLFSEAIKSKLRLKHSENAGLVEALNQKDENGQERCNVTFLISEYFKYICNDDNQPFYGYPRAYGVFDNLMDDRTQIHRTKENHYFFPDELKVLSGKDRLNEGIRAFLKRKEEKNRQDRARNWRVEMIDIEGEERKIRSQLREFRKNEKLIRQYKIQDILLFLMAKDILVQSNWHKDNLSEIENYKLKNISLKEGDENILSLKIPFEVTLQMKDGREITIKQKSLKLKNYGGFFRFVYDQRIKSLLPQIDVISIERDLLEKELEKYDLHRTAIFKLVQDFERSVIDKNNEFKTRKYQFTDLLAEAQGINDTERRKMQLIRNAFCHNYYPELDEVRSTDLPEIAPMLNDTLSSLTRKA